MEDAAEADKDAALRSLVQNLREKGRQPGSAAAAADDDDDEPDDDEPSAGVASSGNVAVEADFIIEQRPGQGVPDVQVPEPPKPQISRCVRSCLHMARALGPVPGTQHSCSTKPCAAAARHPPAGRRRRCWRSWGQGRRWRRRLRGTGRTLMERCSRCGRGREAGAEKERALPVYPPAAPAAMLNMGWPQSTPALLHAIPPLAAAAGGPHPDCPRERGGKQGGGAAGLGAAVPQVRDGVGKGCGY